MKKGLIVATGVACYVSALILIGVGTLFVFGKVISK